MEVHHHPHVEKKKFKEYLLEFLMIFLAVTMGFIAESIREHFIETKTAHEYLESYRNELLANQIQFKHYKEGFTGLVPVYDSIVTILYKKEENKDLPVFSRLLAIGQNNVIITINTSTYQQMVNSGSMRYLYNQYLKDSIARYIDMVNNLINYNDRIVNTEDNNFEEISKLVDVHDFFNIQKMREHNFRYQPEMEPFTLTEEQRRYLIGYFKIFDVQAIVNPITLQQLDSVNESLLRMVNKELNQ
jgi:hypothetical protein